MSLSCSAGGEVHFNRGPESPGSDATGQWTEDTSSAALGRYSTDMQVTPMSTATGGPRHRHSESAHGYFGNDVTGTRTLAATAPRDGPSTISAKPVRKMCKR